MKNIQYSFIWPLIALFFGTNVHNNTASIQAFNYDAVSSENVEAMNNLDCCSGDEEDPIMWGTLSDQSGAALSNANVEVIDNSTSSSLGNTTTDTNGDFAVRVAPGNYYFSITPVGCSSQNSAVFHVVNDTTVSIVL